MILPLNNSLAMCITQSDFLSRRPGNEKERKKSGWSLSTETERCRNNNWKPKEESVEEIIIFHSASLLSRVEVLLHKQRTRLPPWGRIMPHVFPSVRSIVSMVTNIKTSEEMDEAYKSLKRR